MQTPWEHRYAKRTQGMSGSAIRELLKLTQNPDLISFAGGLPAPEVFPVEEFKSACDTVLSEVGSQALQYGTTEGYLPLRELIARHSCRYGIHVDANNIQITFCGTCHFLRCENHFINKIIVMDRVMMKDD